MIQESDNLPEQTPNQGNASLKSIAGDCLSAVLRIRPDVLQSLIRSVREEDRAELTDLLGRNRVFQYASTLERVLMERDQWSEPLKIHQRRNANLHSITVLNNELELTVVPCRPATEDVFTFADGDDDEETILGESRQSLLDKGVRDVDIDLYIAFCHLDFNGVERLLNEGADPEVEINDESIADLASKEVGCTITGIYPVLVGESEELTNSFMMRFDEFAAYDKMLELFRYYGHTPWISAPRGECFDRTNSLDVTFDFPYNGWVDVYFYMDGRLLSELNLSYVNDPFTDIRNWMERLAEGICSETLSIDCELYNAEISFKIDDDSDTDGVFSVSDDSGVGDRFSVHMSKRELTSLLYTKLIDLKEDFEHWNPEEENDFKSLHTIKSCIIERYLGVG